MAGITVRPNWAVKSGGLDPALGLGIVYDGAGGALVTGYFMGVASFGSMSLTSKGASDAFVAHVTTSGAIDWAVQAGGASHDPGYGITHDGAGGALVTGFFSGNASFGSTLLTSRGSDDAFIMHVTASGAIDWAVQAGGASVDHSCGIAHDGAGGALVTGYFSGNASFGSTSLTSLGSDDAFVAHVTASGAFDWAVQAGGSSLTSGRGIAYDGAGGALVTGYFCGQVSFGSTSLTSRGSADAFVAHVTASGAFDWAVQAGGASVDHGWGIAHDGAGGALVTGYFSGNASFGSTSLTSRGSDDAFILHVTASGAIEWAVQAGGASVDQGRGIAHDGAGGALVTGYLSGNASFGSTTLTSLGNAPTCFVASLRPPASHCYVPPGWCSSSTCTYPRTAKCDGYTFTCCESIGIMCSECPAARQPPLSPAPLLPPELPLLPRPPQPPTPRMPLRRLPPPSAQEHESPSHRPPPGSPLDSSLTPAVRGTMALFEQPALVVSAIATSLALLGLLVCVYRRSRRVANNFRVSLDRAQFDLQLLEHRFKQQAHPQWHESTWSVRPPSESPPISIPPGPPSSRGHNGGSDDGSAAGSAAGSSRASPSQDAQGICRPKVDVEAWRVHGLAAAQGDSDAQYPLGVMHADGRGGPKNEAEARLLYGLAAANGHGDAQHSLGVMHAVGRGGAKNEAEARRLLGLAAARGHAGAQYSLGVMHADGHGGPKNEAEARRLYGLAAAQGHAAAQYHLAVMLVQGRGGPKDEAEARLLLGLAAVQGDPHAQYSLGNIHSLGLGGPKDEVEARRLLGLAAAQGHAAAQYDLGILHADGRGGPKDEVEGRRLLGLAAAQGDERAVLRMEQSANAMAEALLAEELADKAKLSARKKKKKKGSEQVRLEIITDESEAAECEVADDSKGDAAASDAAATSHPEASNAALREVIASGDCDTLTAALAEHRAHGSDSLVAEATSIRNRLRERKKKESQRQRRAHASAMTAHAELQSAQLRGDADALREAVDSADAYTDALPGLEAEVNSARARLEQLALQEAVSPVLVESAALPAAASSVAVVLTFGELESATDCFAPERLIGKGGFGLVYRADAIASLPAERRPPTLRATGLAVKRASTVLELRDFETEVAILQSCAHAHLLPLLGVCAEPACLVFPLMVGGSLQARLDLDPRDVAYLQAMGHFVQAPPKPLTWRQRLRAVMQATEALVYLHTPHERKPRTLHRDFKPANILLDHDLHAYLGDTGFAKAARQSGEFSRHSDTTTGRIMCSPGYADIDVLNGEYSELTDGFAVGVTLLVVLTRRDPVRIVDVIEEEHDAEMDDIPAEQLAEPSANWPSEVARALKELHKGLCLLRARRRLRLPDALQTLSALLEAHPTSSQMHQQPEATAASSVTTRDSDASASTTYEASPLSLQVRRMRAEDGPELSVQRNVTDAFSTCMRRLATLYKDAEAQTPEEFDERINYWREACGLPEEVHTRLHTLRRWRNMSEHHLDQPERWASKGPSAKVASEHIAELQVRIDALTFGAARVSDHHRAHAAECAPSLSLPGKGGNTKPNTR